MNPAGRRVVADWRPNAYDALNGFVLGARDDAPALPPSRGEGARCALEAAVLPALRTGRCLVSFSGGRDSSAVLAVATHVARRTGLPEPVPVTIAYDGVPGADERTWQEQVIRHLDLREWLRLDTGDALDFLGTHATDVLRRHGLLWPANTYFHAPMLARASGGALLTGIDGDVLLGGWRWARERGAVPHARSLAGYLAYRGYADAPTRLRAAAFRRRDAPPWLTAAGWHAVSTYHAAHDGAEPWRWDRRVGWWWRRRYLATADRSLALLADDAGVALHHPLQDPAFLAELATDGGRTGFPTRSAALRVILGDLLPEAILTRESKAHFDEVMWGRKARGFAAQWDGSGVDAELVDVDGLRAEWLHPTPHFGSALLLHQAWLAMDGRGA